VTVTDRSSGSGRAFIYGPALAGVTHVYPLLQPSTVAVQVGQARRTYVAFVLPHIAKGKSARLILRFAPPRGRQSIVATDSRIVKASDWNIVSNADCTISKPV
jgi:hypothetical protein